MAPLRVFVADDHGVLRAGLRLLIDAQPDMQVVGEAGNGSSTLQRVTELQPDLILLDLTMPGLGGLEILPLLRQRAPASRILILTMHDNEGYLRQALAAGAAGYVLKGAVDSELLNAIRAVARGETYIHSAITHKLLESIQPSPAPSDDPWESLSSRELEVLRLVALGYTNSEIAEQLSISVKTVETYRARGMEKLNLRTRAELVRAAIAKGLLD
ncbi:MAG: response regulator transcription factor [Anaerolineae bacterium]